jgi:diketogulonate reductase-like aldo/keto reductase
MDPARSNPLRSSEKIAARLGVDYIDVHLLHWRGRVPLVETIEGFDAWELDGMIR